MQDKKEYFTGLVRTIKNKLHDWWVSYDRKLWTARIFVYCSRLLLVVLVGFILFTHFNLFHTDANSARYMLSALVQCQAAIVAIVITLTLIAVQLTASAYSPRVIRIFRDNPDMWLLLVLYSGSIFYGLLVLKMISDEDLFGIPLEIHISYALFLGFFSIMMLFQYMKNIINLLDPASIIKRLAIEITKDKIINQEDPIQPLTDIVHGSIMKYDIETTRVGLKAVTDQVLEIIGPDGEEEISRCFCSQLTRVGRLTASREDEESTTEVIKNLENFGKATAGKGLEKATTQVVMSLEEVGKSAAGKELEDATWEAVKFLGEVGVATAKQGLKGATSRAVSSLEEVGRSAAEKRLDGATKMAAIGLGKVGEAAAEKGLGDVTKWAAICLEEFGVRAAEKRLDGATRRVAESLEKVGKAAEKQCLDGATSRAAMSLIVVGTAYVKNSLEGATEQVAKSLGLEDTTERLARSLAELTISSEEIVKTAIKTYESKFKEQDRDSLQKFMKIYKQKLEELRVKRRT